MLVRGWIQKAFDLYNVDESRPENFSRHTLSSRDFGENEAVVMKERLDNFTHLTVNIQDYARKFEFLMNKLNVYDIIIDATSQLLIQL